MISEMEYKLAVAIKNEIINYFIESGSVISKNLINTIAIVKTKNGWSVEIPAEIYDRKLWDEKKVVVHTGEGSYAGILEKTAKHKNFAYNISKKTVLNWFSSRGYEFKVK